MIIEITQIDPEDVSQQDEILPHYNSAAQDIVLDIAPIDHLPRHASEQNNTNNASQHYSTLMPPPEYDDSTRRTETIELSNTTVSPPQYVRYKNNS